MPTTDTKKSYTVSQVNQSVGKALEETFPDAFWVAGEIQGYNRDASKAHQRKWGQVYFELIEKEPGADTVRAGIKALVWGDAHQTIKEKLQAVATDLTFQDGVQVKLLCRVDFYWPRAGLQLKVLDVDPTFTLGDMERSRRELVEKLKQTGLFDKNRTTEFPLVPLNIGLITSHGSAAYHDFVEELKTSGYAFVLRFLDARMQGVETEADVPRAIAVLERDSAVDVIVLIRGGGSRSDLIWFDKERVALAVARCSKPVVTGIGHEIDLSVADLVAHTSQKTPTAVAGFLMDAVRSFDVGLEEGARRLRELSDRRLEEESRALAESVCDWRERTDGFLVRFKESLSRSRENLRSGARRHTTVAQERLRSVPERLVHGVQSLFKTHSERLAGFQKECSWRDPRRLLARGYSLLYAGGRLAKTIRDVHPGEFIEARLADGFLTANVLATQKDKNNDKKI